MGPTRGQVGVAGVGIGKWVPMICSGTAGATDPMIGWDPVGDAPNGSDPQLSRRHCEPQRSCRGQDTAA